MDPTTAWQSVQSWPAEDRLAFAFRLWDQLVEDGWQPEPDDELAVELDRRLAAHEANPASNAHLGTDHGANPEAAVSVSAVYLPQAEDDVDAAHRSYEGQQIGLGDRFVEAVRNQVDRIRSSPKLYGIVRRNIRAAKLHGFPYVVYYRDRGNDVLIIAVQHGRRSKKVWRDRI